MESTLEIIYKSAMKLLVPLTSEETYKTVVEEAIRLVKADEGLIILEEDGLLRTAYGSSTIAASIKPRKNGFAAKAYKHKKAFIIHKEDFKYVDPVGAQAGVKSIMFVPVSYKHTSIGALVVRSFKEEFFTDKELRILKLFGSMASLAIRKTQLYAETNKALKLRDDFLSMAAHELRTPLTTIYGYVQLLHLKSKNNNSTESKWIKELAYETSRLTKLVNQVLEVNRIRSGKAQYILKECSLLEILFKSIDNFETDHPNYELSFSNDIGTENDTVAGDFNKLLQALVNLLDNAVQYSPSNNKIFMKLKLKKNQFIIFIKDKGKGISKNDIQRVFEDFYRGTNHERESMGMGLYVAKTIVEKHHGSINLKSKINKGTTVEIRLPKAKL